MRCSTAPAGFSLKPYSWLILDSYNWFLYKKNHKVFVPCCPVMVGIQPLWQAPSNTRRLSDGCLLSPTQLAGGCNHMINSSVLGSTISLPLLAGRLLYLCHIPSSFSCRARKAMKILYTHCHSVQKLHPSVTCRGQYADRMHPFLDGRSICWFRLRLLALPRKISAYFILPGFLLSFWLCDVIVLDQAPACSGPVWVRKNCTPPSGVSAGHCISCTFPGSLNVPLFFPEWQTHLPNL